MATNIVDYNSDLVRKKWIREGLIKEASKSFFDGITGRSFNSVVYQAVNTNASDGHTVVFDFDGYLAGGPRKGKERAYGTGEAKKKFSDKITVDRYRYVVDNGDEFDGVNIGDLSTTQHSDSRSKLADLWIRSKDQAIFDATQQAVTHIIQTTSFDFNDLADIENIIKTGYGYSVGGRRMPLKPFKTQDGKPVWILVIDPATKSMLVKSSGFQNIISQADVRGNENRLIKGVLGKVGSLLIMEADAFFGVQKGDIITNGYANPNNVIELQMAGLRQYKVDNFNPATWSGESGFEGSTQRLTSRNLILGQSAVQFGLGKSPDYKFRESEDFGITTESLLEVWTNFKATKYFAENEDYNTPEAGITVGAIGLDVAVTTTTTTSKIVKPSGKKGGK
jgi:ribosome modulation factor